MRRLLLLLLLLAVPLHAQPDTRLQAIKLAALNEGFWKSTAEPKGSVTSRGLFAYAFVLCEANQKLERLEPIFDLAVRMQDHDPQSRSYGNFKWKWDDAKIVDYNAVDFSMRGGSLLWLKHKDTIPAPAREKLRGVLEFATEGCLRHKVNESYTNIALMNAGDLILLGETLDKPKVADEGYRRLERALLYTYEFGTHEYVSPTYYGPDLDALVMIEAYAKRARGVEQARALLEFFWHDIALNWFAPAQRLSGTNSRSYDYLSALGELDKHMQLNGWLEGQPGHIDSIYSLQARWRPSPDLKKLNAQYPRWIEQKWGPETTQWRWNYVNSDVALSTSGATYGGRMDFPLTVDFPGDRKSVRCYFTSDGRGDPYGKIKVAESATHSKALHLSPVWTAGQEQADALGTVLYPDKEISPDCETLESHFVMPLDNDGLWIGKEKISFVKNKAATFPVPPNDAVFLRKGSAALAVRVLWTRDVKGKTAPVSLVYDGNAFGAIRLTVTHYRGDKIGEFKQENGMAGATFAVNVKSDLNQEKWAQFQKHVAEDPTKVTDLSNGGIFFTGSKLIRQETISNRPGVLSLNNEEIGRKILAQVEPLKSAGRGTDIPKLQIPAGSIYFEAESAQVLVPFEHGEDTMASGGKFVWAPGEVGQGGGSSIGSITWELQNTQPGPVYLWGRVQTPTPDDDSFFLRIIHGDRTDIPSATWALGTHTEWEWVRFDQNIQLPLGKTTLQLRIREDGAKIDRLFLTRDPNEKPK